MTLGAGVYKGLVVTRPNQKRVAELAKVRQRCLVLREGAWIDEESSDIVAGFFGHLVLVVSDPAKLEAFRLGQEGAFFGGQNMGHSFVLNHINCICVYVYIYIYV